MFLMPPLNLMKTSDGSLHESFSETFNLQLNGDFFHSNILYSSQWEIKAVVRSHNEEHISVILNHEPHAHTHNLHTLILSYSKPKIIWNDAFSVKPNSTVSS